MATYLRVALGSTSEDESGDRISEVGDRSDGDEEDDSSMLVERNDSSDGPAFSKSTIVETRYKVWKRRSMV